MSAPSMRSGQAVAAAARAAVGARFRLHGRDPAHGLDCVGLAALACGIEAPTGYALRTGDAAAVAARLDAVLARAEAGSGAGAGGAAGDLLLLRTGPAQLHLGIRTEDGLVHADAALRRVVERPGAPPWPVLGAWRVAPVGQASAIAEAPHRPPPPPGRQ